MATKKIKKEAVENTDFLDESEETKEAIAEVSPDITEKARSATEHEIVHRVSDIVITPRVTPEQAKAAWKAYTALCNAILVPEDFTKINSFVKGKGTVIKLFKNKSAWRKLATAFNLSLEVLKEERVEYPDYFVVKTTARVTAPNGRFVDGTGTCSSNERGFAHVEHDVRAQAETRAKSRAISDLIGGGETTAEEMMQMEENTKAKCVRDHDALPEKVVVTEGKNKGRPYKRCTSCTFFEWQDQPTQPATN